MERGATPFDFTGNWKTVLKNKIMKTQTQPLKRIFRKVTGHGIIGMDIQLNFIQCMTLAEFGTELAHAKETGQFTYPDQIDDFFKAFESFKTLSDENLFKETEALENGPRDFDWNQ